MARGGYAARNAAMKGTSQGSVGLPKARLEAIQRHAKDAFSNNAARQDRGRRNLQRMKLSPAEHQHVQKYNPYAKMKPVSEQPLTHDHLKQINTGPAPILGYTQKQIAHPNRTGKQLTHIRNEHLRNQAQFNAILNPISHQNLANAAEDLTGYHEIRHIREHPLAGGLALAGILPIGKVGHIVEEAHAAEEGVQAAKTAERGSRVAEFRAARKAVKIARRGPVRTDEQATQHVLAQAKKARQQGFGRIIPKKPEVAPGEISRETGGEAGRIIRQGLRPDFKGMGKFEKVGAKIDNPGIGTLRKQQEEIRAEERSARAGAIERASEGKSGIARHIAAKQELEGKLPARVFHGFKDLTPQLRDEAIDHIYQHPHFQSYEKVRTVDALQEALAGKVPTKGDQKLLERAFGLEKEGGLRAAMKNGGLKDKIINLLNVPRSLMASFDLSAPFRQGLVVATHSPKLFASEFGRMFKAATSEDAFQGIMQDIHQRPTFPLMEKAKLGLTDIGETAKSSGSENLSKREEQFISNYAEQLPGIGKIVRGSDRAYVGFLNKTRADLFDSLLHQAAGQGYHLAGPKGDKLVQDIAKFVNSATGRGDMSKLADHTATMNAFFFSPRLLKSRLDFLNPAYYMRMEPFARRQALKAAYRLLGTLSTVLYAAKLAGATVVTDPHNADFAKIRIGNVRIDPAGGFTQPIRLLAELAPGFAGGGKIISSTTGKKEYLTGAFGHSSRLSILENFAEGKLAPVPGFLAQGLQGQQFGGGKLDWSASPGDPNSLITSHYLPLLIQDIEGVRQQTKNNAELGGLGLADLFGVGVTAYSAKKKKGGSGRASYSNSGGYSGGSGYSGSSGYSSGSGYG